MTTVLNRSARHERKSRGVRSGSPEGNRKWCRTWYPSSCLDEDGGEDKQQAIGAPRLRHHMPSKCSRHCYLQRRPSHFVQVSRVIPARRRSFAPRIGQLFPLHPSQQAANTKSPDVVQRLPPFSTDERPNSVLVLSYVPVVVVGVRHGESRVRPALGRDAERVHAVRCCSASHSLRQ